ncbi:SDR family NAD(P)-dependent oxidoreductase [Pectinatus haikarae]|uniref:SDR family NAD(P)-dependent oxidoreductase n=1 Tax=Pectinatus haikarae TaxID=349096 RepID=UPI0018C69EE1|nr:SDR family NAD(P)-dependent oxidoreductase [Pectinatus haikarae]
MKALITGANKGIGLAIAKSLGKSGVKILVGARNESRGQETVKKLSSQGIAASFIKIDLNNFDTIHNAAKEINELDLLINNAGIPDSHKTDQPDLDQKKMISDYTTDDLRETLEVNFLGTHEMIKVFLPKLVKNGKIINITIPIQPNDFWHPLAYQTSKAAQNVMTMAYALEFKNMHSEKQIFGIMPGGVATDLNGHTAGALDGYIKSAEEAGEIIAKLALDTENHNGQIVQFDGKIITDYEAQIH